MNRKRGPVALGTQEIKRRGRLAGRAPSGWAEGSGDSGGGMRAAGGGRQGRKNK